MSSTFSISSRKTVAVLTVAVISAVSASQPATGQTARVQFINASVYEEAETIDFYVNGVLKLDDLAYGSGSPYMDYPATVPLRIETTWGNAPDRTNPFYSETRRLEPNERYVVVAAGDPLRREGEPSFEFFVLFT